MENTGVILQQPTATDFIVGSDNSLSAIQRLPSGDWKPYLPTDEGQGYTYFDSMACVTFSALNSIETQMNWMKSMGKIPSGVLTELMNMGFFDANGRFNASDRFTAKMSGTTRQGNSLVKVWDSIRNSGVLPEKDWTYSHDERGATFVWEDYYKEIPQELKDKAKRFTELFTTSYQWLIPGGTQTQDHFKVWMQMAPIQIATATCPPWNTTDVLQACSLGVSHATMLFCANDGWYDDEDHYKPFQKRLALDYPIPNALLGVLSLKTPPPIMSTPIDPSFGKKLEGRILLAVEEHGDIYYVTPDGKKARIGRTPEDVAAFQKAINEKRVPITGISTADLAKIASV